MKRTLRILAIIVAVVLLILVAIPFLVNVNSFRPRLETELTGAFGRQVRVGNLRLSLLSGSVTAEDLAIADDPAFSTSPFIRAKSLKVGVEIVPLILSRTIHVTGITLDHPEVTLLHSPAGKWNFSSLGAQGTKPAPSTERSATPQLSVSKLNINDGRVSISKIRSSAKPQIFGKVDVEVRDFSFTTPFPFTMTANLPGGGDLKLDGKAGPINSSDASLTPLEANVKVRDLDLGASGFVEASSGIAGKADFDGHAQSDGKQLHTNGSLKASKLKLNPKGSPASRTVEVKYAIEHGLEKRAGTITQGDVNIGKATTRLTGGYRMEGDSTLVNLKLAGPGMPVDELVAMLPALGVVLPSGASLQGGTLATSLDIAGPIDKLVTNGPIRLSDTKLANFDLGSKLSTVAALAGIKSGADTVIQNFSSSVRVAPDGIRAQQIDLLVPSLGEVTGSGTISPSNALDFKMIAKLASGNAVGQLSTIVLGNNSNGVPFFIRGTTSSPVFEPDLKSMVGGKVKGLQLPGNTPNRTQYPLDTLQNLFKKKKPK